MNWFESALSPFQWVLLGLVPLIIFLLYFLKLRRTPVEVPSTYLWTKALEDIHVNSLWQRLRRNLLMFLQLLLAMLLLLSCLRPGCEGTKLKDDRFVFLIDHSASMSATDMPGGKSRLEVAKEEAIKLIDRMKSSDSAMVISFSDVSRTVQSYTTNPSQLKNRVRSIRQTQRSSDMLEALNAASGLANPGRTSDKNSNRDLQVAQSKPATMFILSDGAVKSVPDFFLGSLKPEYRPIGGLETPNNVGIVALSVSDPIENDSQLQCYARLFNSGEEDRTVKVTLKIEGEIFDAQSVEVPGSLGSDSDGSETDSDPEEATDGEVQVLNNGTLGVGLVFDLTSLLSDLDQPQRIELAIDDPDVYMQDNKAWTVINPPRESNVLILSEGNEYLELVTETKKITEVANVFRELPEFMDSDKYEEQTTLGFYDLVIFEGCTPKKMPLCNTLFWGTVPPMKDWEVSEISSPTAIIDTNNSHPMMVSIQMGNVNIINSGTIKGPKGSVSLLNSATGSIMRLGARGGFQDLVIGFPLQEIDSNEDVNINTDWMTKLSFPLFVQRCMTLLGNGKNYAASLSSKPGGLVNFKTSLPFESVDVKSPNGKKSKLLPRPDRTFVLNDTAECGLYEVQGASQELPDVVLPVNLFDRNESNIVVRDKLTLGYEEVTGEVTRETTRKQYWRWFLLLGLVVLVVEWYIFNKRVLL